MTLDPTDVVLRGMALLDPLREEPGNRGAFVDAINRATGSPLGSPWCLNVIHYVGAGLLGKAWPLPKTGSCDELLAWAKAKKLVCHFPHRGDVALRLNPANPDDATHAMLVDAVLPDGRFATWEGNGSPAGSAEGTDVLQVTRDPRGARYVFIPWASLL